MKDTSKNKGIKYWAEADRPREKLLLKGGNSLSDAELIAILIGSGTPTLSAVELAQQILQSAGNNLIELSKLTVKDLQKFKGIGEAKSVSIVAALELGKRRRGAEVIERKKVLSSKDAFEYFSSVISDYHYEQFWILLLNQANKIIHTAKISEGGITQTTVDIKKIYKLTLDYHAPNIILCHNHPSGNLNPSREDIRLTQKIISAGKLLDVNVLDHIILGYNTYYSFKDHGEM